MRLESRVTDDDGVVVDVMTMTMTMTMTMELLMMMMAMAMAIVTTENMTMNLSNLFKLLYLSTFCSRRIVVPSTP